MESDHIRGPWLGDDVAGWMGHPNRVQAMRWPYRPTNLHDASLRSKHQWRESASFLFNITFDLTTIAPSLSTIHV